jgi:hypothetical protein
MYVIMYLSIYLSIYLSNDALRYMRDVAGQWADGRSSEAACRAEALVAWVLEPAPAFPARSGVPAAALARMAAGSQQAEAFL